MMNRKVAALLAAALVGLGSMAKADTTCSKERAKVEQKKEDVRTACGFMCASAEQKSREADAKVALAKAEQELAACEKQVQEEVEHKKIAATCTGDQKYNRVTRRCELHCPEGHAMTLDGKCIELRPAASAPDLAPASAEPAATPSSTEPAQASPPSTAGQRKVTYTVVCMPDVLGEYETKKEAGAKAVEEATATSRTCIVRETIENPHKGEKNNKIVFTFTGKPKEKKQESKAEPPKEEKKDVVTPGKEAPKNDKKTEGPAKPTIQHDPIGEATAGESLQILVKYSGFQPNLAILYVRTTGTKPFRQVPIPGEKIAKGIIHWDFNKGDVKGNFEYFVTVNNGKEVLSSGSADKPYSVQVTQSGDYKLYCSRTTKGPPRSLIKTWPVSNKPDKTELDNAGKGLFDCELFQGNDSVTEADKEVAQKNQDSGKAPQKQESETRWIDSHVVAADKAVGGFHGYLVTGLSFTLNGHSMLLYNPVPKVNFGAGFQVLGQYRLSIFAEAGVLLPADAWCCSNMEIWWAFGPRIKLSDRWSFATGFKGQHRVATTRFVASDNSRIADLGKTNSYRWRSDLEVRIIKRLSWTLSFEVGDRGVTGANALVAPTGAIVDLTTGLKVHGW